MSSTPLSLLHRLKSANSEAAEWTQLHDMYLPLIRRWVARVPGIGADAADLAQEVFLIVSRELPGFERRRAGAFRSWLRKITINRVRVFVRQRRRHPITGQAALQDFLDRLEDPESELAREWDRLHDAFVLDRLLEIVRGDFAEKTWMAFTRYCLEEAPLAQVTAELGMTESAVMSVKARVLKRLRDEAQGLVD